MNERIKELAEQAGFQEYFLGSGYIARNTELERFAELVRQDEANGMRETYIKMIHGAVAEEREACAALCEKFIPSFDDGVFFAKVIRARGDHENAPLP